MNSRIHQHGNTLIIRPLSVRPQQTVGQFISHLYHIRQDALPLKFTQYRHRIVVHSRLQTFSRIVIPGLGLYLLAGICPEVAVMEIQQHVHAPLFHPLCHLHGSFHVIGARPIRLSLSGIRIVPEAETYCIGTVFLQNCQQISLVSVFIIKFCSKLFQLRQRRYIHSLYKFFI